MQLCTIASITTVILIAKQTLQERFRHEAVYALCQNCFHKERWVIFVGESFLKRTEGPIWRVDLFHREVCASLGSSLKT